MRTSWKRTILVGAAITSLGVLPGCIGGSSKTHYTGRYFGTSTFDQIEEGHTTEEWVIAALGQPEERIELSDGSELLKWKYSRYSKSSGGIFPFIGGSSERETMAIGFVELRDGVVTKAWRD